MWRGLKSTAISCEPRIVECAFALQRLRCFSMAELISLGRVKRSENGVKEELLLVNITHTAQLC